MGVFRAAACNRDVGVEDEFQPVIDGGVILENLVELLGVVSTPVDPLVERVVDDLEVFVGGVGLDCLAVFRVSVGTIVRPDDVQRVVDIDRWTGDDRVEESTDGIVTARDRAGNVLVVVDQVLRDAIDAVILVVVGLIPFPFSASVYFVLGIQVTAA